MNNNLLFTMLAASTMMLATGCSSSDDTVATQESNLATVSFSVQADAVVGTRAISDGTGADELIYRVFDKEGHVISASLAKKTETGLTDLLTGHKVTLYLAKGQTYKVAFWAQDANCTAYTVDDNMGVTVNYAGVNNDETRDAFFKTVDVTVTGDMSVDVTLKRPFAQINVGCTTDDWNAAQASNINVKTSAVTIKDAATKLNVIDGTVSGNQDVTYAAANIPTETLKVDADGDGTKEEYKYLSMCYILPNETTTGAAKTTAGTTFTFHPQTGNDITLSDGLQAIPVQRNYRTNIVGKILSGEVSFNVKVDPIYDGDHNYQPWDGRTLTEPTTSADGKTYEVNTPAELAWVFNNGYNPATYYGNNFKKSVSVNKDLNMGGHALYRVWIAADNLELNGNGHTVSNFKLTKEGSGVAYSYGLFRGDALEHGITVKNITFNNVGIDNNGESYGNGYAGVLFGDIQNGKTVNVSNVHVTNSHIKGIRSVGSLVGFVSDGSTLNIDNCSSEGNTLTNYSVTNKSGYVGGLVGRSVGTVNITKSTVKNTTITAFYATRRKVTSIDEIVGDRTGGTSQANVSVDDATVTNSTGTAAGNAVTTTQID